MSMPADVSPTERDAKTHSLLGGFTHPDGRCCGRHQRLGQWIVLDDPASGVNVFDMSGSFACQRSHSLSGVGDALVGAV